MQSAFATPATNIVKQVIKIITIYFYFQCCANTSRSVRFQTNSESRKALSTNTK